MQAPVSMTMVTLLMTMGQINSTIVLNYCSVFHSFLIHNTPTDLVFQNKNNGTFTDSIHKNIKTHKKTKTNNNSTTKQKIKCI